MQQALALSLAAHVFADWQNNTAVFIIEYLCHSEVDSARATEDAFKTCDSTNQLATSEITSSQQSKQDGQRTKYHLFRRWVAQRTNEHKASENAHRAKYHPMKGAGLAGSPMCGITIKPTSVSQNRP